MGSVPSCHIFHLYHHVGGKTCFIRESSPPVVCSNASHLVTFILLFAILPCLIAVPYFIIQSSFRMPMLPSFKSTCRWLANNIFCTSASDTSSSPKRMFMLNEI